MAKLIDFSGNRAWDPSRDSMSFEVTVDGKKTRCLISREALEDHYDADQGKTVEQAFDDNRFEIEDVAGKIIQSDQVDSQGEYLIKSEDI
jgi:hypothetical protein